MYPSIIWMILDFLFSFYNMPWSDTMLPRYVLYYSIVMCGSRTWIILSGVMTYHYPGRYWPLLKLNHCACWQMPPWKTEVLSWMSPFNVKFVKNVCTTATEYRRIFHLSKHTPFPISLPYLVPLYKAWSYGRYVSLKYKGPARVKGYFKVLFSLVYYYKEVILAIFHCKKCMNSISYKD